MAVLEKIRKQNKRYNRREVIYAKMARRFGEGTFEFRQIMKSCDESCRTHNRKKRRNGASLISHERGMVAIADMVGINDYRIYVAIFLHDMHEDYPQTWPLRRIESEYGEFVANLVDALSKPSRDNYRSDLDHDNAIFAKVRRGGYWAKVIKCIDRLHNMLTLWGSHESNKKKINQTVTFVLPISIECNALTYELMLATTEQVRTHNMKTRWVIH